ncbi:MAG: choice-of-anchor L domain-containing protein [Flavobacteriales bacterium]|nr:choice-of-anchor L domain-containing protein [Flavobacteriales bacterium]
MKKLLPTAAFSLFALAGQAQLTITDSLTIGSITTLLEGIGVTVSNVTVNCPERAIGHFVGTSELSITEGLVLTTGGADLVAGPVANFASDYLGTPGDADLDNALGMGGITYEACVLEFDCVPQGDTLLFNFSFGSEEYQEFVGSAFNDVFGIYLSGPGFGTPTNVAAIPGGTVVSINNVNNQLNSRYYHDNEGIPGIMSPTTASPPTSRSSPWCSRCSPTISRSPSPTWLTASSTAGCSWRPSASAARCSPPA